MCGMLSSVGLVVWPVKYGYSLLESVLHFVSLVVHPINISGVLSDFSSTTMFFKDFAGAPSGQQSPSSFLMSDAQE